MKLPGFESPSHPSRALRPGFPHEYVHQVQRERLIDAFVRLAAEEGIEAAGVKATCQRAGVAFNTFYQHFQSKEELFLVAFDIGVETMFERTNAAFSTAEGPWAARVEAAMSTFLTILSDNPAFARFFAVESRKIGDMGNTHVDRGFERSFAMFAGARPAVELPMSDLELAQMMIGGLFAPIYWAIRSHRTSELSDLTPKLMAFILALFDEEEGSSGL